MDYDCFVCKPDKLCETHALIEASRLRPRKKKKPVEKPDTRKDGYQTEVEGAHD